MIFKVLIPFGALIGISALIVTQTNLMQPPAKPKTEFSLSSSDAMALGLGVAQLEKIDWMGGQITIVNSIDAYANECHVRLEEGEVFNLQLTIPEESDSENLVANLYVEGQFLAHLNKKDALSIIKSTIEKAYPPLVACFVEKAKARTLLD